MTIRASLAAARRAALGLALLGAGSGPAGAQEPLTLPQAIQLAQEQGHLARAAAATRDAARYRDRAFYSRLLPQLFLGGSLPAYNRSIIPVVQPDGSTLFRPQDQTNAALTMTLSQKLPVLGGDFFVTSSLARLRVSGAQSTQLWSSTPVSFGLRQDLLRPNAAGWDRREQDVRSDLAERQYLEAREDLAIQTAGLFFDTYAARVALATATSNAAVNDTLYTLNKGRFEVGKIGENDLLQSELALLRARTSLDAARLELDRSTAALRLALNLPADRPLEIAVTAEVPVFEADTSRATAEALRNRASVSDVALQEVQARRRVTEARLSNWIGASISASYGYNQSAPERNQVYKNLLEARQFTLALQAPLFQWGGHHEGVQAAEADRERVASTTRVTLEQTAQEAHFAALQLAQARRGLALSAKGDTVADKRFEVAYNRYVIGRIAIDNLFVAQAEKDAARVQFVQALRGYWQAYYRLRRLTLFDFETGRAIQ
ncbi:MAG TPA: TolC family protein [Gemmatimonadales bacterium]|jgi:outer membrane protein TolC|nr:TolC family protein [Gemmatimonadales bacterium]